MVCTAYSRINTVILDTIRYVQFLSCLNYQIIIETNQFEIFIPFGLNYGQISDQFYLDMRVYKNNLEFFFFGSVPISDWSSLAWKIQTDLVSVLKEPYRYWIHPNSIRSKLNFGLVHMDLLRGTLCCHILRNYTFQLYLMRTVGL